MQLMQAKIEAPEYLSGRDVVENLKNVTKSRDLLALADVIGVPRSTISTWNTRNMTPFEVLIRIHLETGASMKWLALGIGEAFPESKESKVANATSIDSFRLRSGILEETGSFVLDKSISEELESENLILVKEDSQRLLIDKESTHATSGKYLINTDGSFSINELQRLPGKKLAISFNGSTINVAENDIKVVGRVAIVINAS
ncbi:transcriptional regulator [Aliivibrio fischeri]|uniref:Transcriptional regulator n=2 Tax=Aliivibrio fischeri TaxID=668 RepID=A0A844P485_ALIFS|nr:transcriptional regulator [Aliivibrio fischeri]MUK50105.1 transcriptional regulator [Aliivibrio fischeri]